MGIISNCMFRLLLASSGKSDGRVVLLVCLHFLTVMRKLMEEMECRIVEFWCCRLSCTPEW